MSEEKRKRILPIPTFDESLPVVAIRHEIGRAIRENQVVILCGETGSGKTTQLPKICLEIGRGAEKLIGHTQPRRVAARSIANRIAKELKSDRLVGYKVRFTDRTGEDACIKLMTDGILLAETRSDPQLLAYDTLIVDEAHERSLNIDFLLGYLKTLLPRRPDLKVVVTSATIDAERFSRHFGGAPVIRVEGRSYPVEIRYRPIEEEEDPDLDMAILKAVDEVERHPGDILAFLPGEREIRSAAEALRKHSKYDILPLYSRLSVQEQDRVFSSGGARRIVLATNVAETSLTVPNIGVVIDPGLARINRYSYRNKVDQLMVEKISQASANQRSGRSGRVMQGICVRLYSEADFSSRPEYTDPEILRTSLAAAILKMKSMRLGEIADFPFIDPPSPRMISDGYQLLGELGAVDEGRKITALGRSLARLPCDPRIGRMILAAKGALSEVLVIAAALSIQDPREAPSAKREAAEAAQAPFADERSEFMVYLKLWKHFDEAYGRLSNRKYAEECRKHFLSPLRMREWRDLHGQLHAQVSEMGMKPNEQPASYEEIHRAILTGLLGNLGMKFEERYLGARGIRFQIFPGSKLKKKPKWLMAAEITETSRLYARTVAEIDPAWVEEAAGHLLKRSHFDPHWERKGARVCAYEQITLYGLVIEPKRKVHFGPIDPKTAREIFIRSALVGGDFDTRAPFFLHNAKLLEEIGELEHKSRRHDVLVDEHRLHEFYSALIPEGIVNGASFEKWRREAERGNPKLLFLGKETLMRHEAEEVTLERFPDEMEAGGNRLPLSYRFEPGHVMDGVTVSLPLHLLNQVEEQDFERLVPGLIREKITFLIKGLPKPIRTRLIPVSENVNLCMDAKGPLLAAMRAALAKSVAIPEDAWPEIPDHLKMNFRIVDEKNEEIGMGRDLAELRKQFGKKAESGFSKKFEKSGLTEWNFGELSERIEFEKGGLKLTGYPSLVDDGDSVSLVLADTREKAEKSTVFGVARLLRLALKAQFSQLAKSIPNPLALRYSSLYPAEAFREELLRTISLEMTGEIPKNREEFEERLRCAKPLLQKKLEEMLKLLGEIAEEYPEVKRKLDAGCPKAWDAACSDMKMQLSCLIFPGFISSHSYSRLKSFPRYLKAMKMRIEKLAVSPEKDRQAMAEISPRWLRYEKSAEKSHLEEYRWMMEELRVSLFAQQLKTPTPVSPKRIDRLWEGK